MKKITVLLILLMLAACSSSEPEKQVAVSASAAATKVAAPATQTPAKSPEKQEFKIVYPSKVQNYINNTPAVLQLREVAPQYAEKVIAEQCTVEKFIAGLSAKEIQIEKKTSDTLLIKTFGSKLGNGALTIRLQKGAASLTSATIGRLTQTDSNALEKITRNICSAVDRK